MQQQAQDSEAKHIVAEKQTVELRGSLAEKDQQLALKSEELKLAQADRDESVAQTQRLRDELRKESVQLTSQLTSAKLMISSLESEKAEFDSKAAQLAGQPTEQQTRLSEAQAAQIKTLVDKLESEQASRRQAAALAEDHARQLSVLANELEAAQAGKKASLNSSATNEAALRLEIASLKEKLGARAKSVADQPQVQTAPSQSIASQSIASQSTASQSIASQSIDSVESRSAQEDLKADLRAQEKRIMELESENHEAHEKLAALMRQAKVENSSKPAPAKKKKPISYRKASSKVADKNSGADRVSGKVSNKGAGKDDLTRIVGIGKVYQGKLNKIGVKSFEQIAAWTKKETESFQDKLGLGDRITKEQWVKQAKTFARKKRKK